jgi:hypothetical protein
MWQLLILVSSVPIAALLLLRSWWGLRVLKSVGARTVSAAPQRWLAITGCPASPPTAAAAGRELRQAALDDWRAREPGQVKAWESARRFGMAAPPLAVVIVLLGIIAARIQPMLGIAGVCVLVALAAVFNLLHLGAEIRAIAAVATRVRESRAFHRQDDEEAVISCATAHAWCEAVPPILRWLR